MVIAQKYSHLNGEEFLLVHHKKLYQELIHIVESIDAEAHRTKISREKTMRGRKLLMHHLEVNFVQAAGTKSGIPTLSRQTES
jgi:hypothetical protein